ncbi:hypothetical protein TELCIR_04651 [Teladorsagia circumcincta]|uniref:Receptor ligand binding region domain-containing protein n=1 Tax=Teladorsagia circumcincta TaxID=45464 RepID=A0A2G9UT89_TELCI|nr:hypothetical protein TELCIR_04651 [Teladorsagia circumcincta]
MNPTGFKIATIPAATATALITTSAILTIRAKRSHAGEVPNFTSILNVGFLCAYNNTEITPYVGWRETAGGIGVAWDKIVADRMLPDYTDLNLTWVMGECVEAADAGALINWIQSGANVVIGPACSASALVSGTVAKYFDFPIVIWAPLFPSALLSTVEYTTLMAPTFSSINQAQTIVRFLQRYGWSDIAMIYYLARSSLIPRCSNIFNDLEILLNANSNMTIAYRRLLLAYNNETFRNSLQAIKDVSRVTVSCFEDDVARRNFMVSIAEAGMDTDQYMWIMIESRKTGFAKALPIRGKGFALRPKLERIQLTTFQDENQNRIDVGIPVETEEKM